MINFWFSKSHMTGGNIYNQMAFKTLKKMGFDVRARIGFLPYHGRGATYLNALYTFFFTASNSKDIDIMDYSIGTWCSQRHRASRIMLFFHFDLDETSKKRKHQFFMQRFLKNTKNAKVIVISTYWKKYMESLGLHDVEIIYCGYDIAKYRQYQSREAFLKKYNLKNRPIIYLGKNSKPKTLNAYNILKPLENELSIITSGPKREFSGPIRLDLNFKAYSSLLHLSDVTVVLPQFEEGWSRIAHESIICGTPVIGNGKGGMGELLGSSNQYIYDEGEAETIRKKIKEIVSTKQKVDEKDRAYACMYDLFYLENAWRNLLTPYTKRGASNF